MCGSLDRQFVSPKPAWRFDFQGKCQVIFRFYCSDSLKLCYCSRLFRIFELKFIYTLGLGRAKINFASALDFAYICSLVKLKFTVTVAKGLWDRQR